MARVSMCTAPFSLPDSELNTLNRNIKNMATTNDPSPWGRVVPGIATSIQHIAVPCQPRKRPCDACVTFRTHTSPFVADDVGKAAVGSYTSSKFGWTCSINLSENRAGPGMDSRAGPYTLHSSWSRQGKARGRGRDRYP